MLFFDDKILCDDYLKIEKKRKKNYRKTIN